jgi:hypothetical protein
VPYTPPVAGTGLLSFRVAASCRSGLQGCSGGNTGVVWKIFTSTRALPLTFRKENDNPIGFFAQDKICDGMSLCARRQVASWVTDCVAVLLTMLGAAGESLGMDRLLKSNTPKIRTHSLFRQGCMLYELIPTVPDQRLFPLMARFAETVSKCRSFSGLFEGI